MQLVLRVIGILGIIISVIWFIVEPSFSTLSGILASLAAFLASFVVPKQEKSTETLDQRNRRVMLKHVESSWIKNNLENSLHRVALRELGIKEDPSTVRYPWTIKQESTGKTLPADKSMLEIFEEVGLGRSLLILGTAGSGKTIMLLELTRQLIERARAEETEPIPVVFNLGSWKEGQVLTDWLAEQLNIHYSVPKKTALAWINENRMLLLLDGLDEVIWNSRVKCVNAINQFRKEHGLTSLVICSRSEEFSAIDAKLSYEGGIILQPLTSEQINAYFDLFGKSRAFIKKLLKEDKGLQELAKSPLMLSIMALAYKDLKINQLHGSKNIEEQRRHIFDTYIEHMFERSTHTANAAFSKLQTTHYLGWLAGKMDQHNAIPYQIEVMQPSWLEGQMQRLYRLFFGLLFGLAYGLASGLITRIGFGLTAGLVAGLIGWLIFGLIFGLDSQVIIMRDKLKWAWKEARKGIRSGLIGGLISGLITGVLVFILQLGGLIEGLIVGLMVMALTILVGTLIDGLISEQIAETTRPGQRLKQTLFNSVFFGLAGVLLGGLIFGLGGMLLGGPLFGRIFAPLGMLAGGLGSVLVGTGQNLLRHFALRFVLARYQLLPWLLIPFLEHAVDLIFLRRAGGSYIFVHRSLMEHFAEMEV